MFQQKLLLGLSVVGLLAMDVAYAANGTDESRYKFQVSTTLPTLTNWLGDDLEMYEGFLGYKITDQDLVGIKAVTWKLKAPLGIPWGPSLMNEREEYPGRVREYGVGIRYQRFLWRGLFTSAEITPMKKIFLDENNKTLEEGFRLYTSYHLGYNSSFFNGRVFVEPQLHCNYWPIDSKGPEAFKKRDEKWNNYFLFEPNIYLGINF